jgi:hypothetical protein
MGTIFEMDIPNGFKKSFLDPKQGEGESPIYALDYPNGFVNYPNVANAVAAGLSYTGLNDTPNSYTGEADKLANVKTDETGMDFISQQDVVNNGFFPGATQGDLAMRSAGGWQLLPPGPAGQVLTSQGPLADLTYAAAGGAGKELAPTYVVGSADAGDVAADCDFLHQNGVFDGIAAAVAAANAAGPGVGGRIYIRRGLYDVPSTLTLNERVEMMGEGYRTQLDFVNVRSAPCLNLSWLRSGIRDMYINFPPCDGTGGATAPLVIDGQFSSVRNVHFSVYTDMVFPTNWQVGMIWVRGNNVHLDRISFEDDGFDVGTNILVLGSNTSRADDFVMSNSYLQKDTAGYLCYIQGTIGCSIKDTRFQHGLGAYASALVMQSYNFITDVNIHQCKMDGNIDLIGQTQQIVNTRISKCTVRATDKDGIRFSGGVPLIIDSSIVDNFIELESVAESSLSCIYASAVQKVDIRGNLCRTPLLNTTHRGIFVGSQGNVSVEDNMIYMLGDGNAQNGIQLWTTSDRCSVKGNYVEPTGGQKGIYVQGDYHTVDGNTISHTATTVGQVGIELLSSTYATVTGNIVRELGNGATGILVDATSQRVACNANIVETDGATGTGISIDTGGAATKGTCTANVVNPGGTPITVGAQVISANNQVT